MKKKNSGMVFLIILIIVGIICGVSGFIFIDMSAKKSNSNDKKTTTAPVENADKNGVKNGDCYKTTADEERCISFLQGNIMISKSGEADSEGFKVYINDNEIKQEDMEASVYAPKYVNENTVAIDFGAAEYSSYTIFDKNANKIFEENFENIENEKGNIYLYDNDYVYDYEAKLCSDHAETDIVSTKYELELDENKNVIGKKVSEEKSVFDIINEKYNTTCENIKNSTDPSLEAAKALANGQ